MYYDKNTPPCHHRCENIAQCARYHRQFFRTCVVLSTIDLTKYKLKPWLIDKKQILQPFRRNLSFREPPLSRSLPPDPAMKPIIVIAQHGKEAMLGGQRRDVVVLMCDIRNFTPLSESMPPEALTELLNSYFSEMVIAIHSYEGMVDKFIGDAVMAVFGLVNNHHNAAVDAVRAAQEMQQRLKEFNDRQSLSHKPIIQNGIGIHAGDAVAGYIGSVDRLEFTVIGTIVNIAARIESHSKAPNPQILFSPEIAQRIKNDIPVVSIGKASLKGVSRDLELFSLQELVHADSTITTGSDL